MQFRVGFSLWACVLLACGGSVDNGGRGGSGGTGANPSGGTGAVATGGGTGGGTGGIGTGGIGTGGVGTGGVGIGGVGTGGISTGGFGAGGSGGVGGEFCGAICKETSAGNCPNETPYDQCLANCQSDLPLLKNQCAPVLNGLYSCITTQAKPACTDQGDTKILGCDGQVLSYVQCTECIPLASDDKCQACSKVQCCAERSALYNSPSFLKFFSCANACQTQSCQQDCFMQFPDLQQLAGPLGTCQGQKCGC